MLSFKLENSSRVSQCSRTFLLKVSQCSLISYLYFFVRPSFTLLALVAKALKRPSKRSIVAKIHLLSYIFLEKASPEAPPRANDARAYFVVNNS